MLSLKNRKRHKLKKKVPCHNQITTVLGTARRESNNLLLYSGTVMFTVGLIYHFKLFLDTNAEQHAHSPIN